MATFKSLKGIRIRVSKEKDKRRQEKLVWDMPYVAMQKRGGKVFTGAKIDGRSFKEVVSNGKADIRKNDEQRSINVQSTPNQRLIKNGVHTGEVDEKAH
ncbi:hypothetical protein CCACVL1_04853 [Corchorus capsularis]|uniref:Uncharacterized protein n=1 Tax=Corchorus capsularis TaxID=210143 RepID=A0A1R3JP37_COCAP|nr:hypothetical protein CCACVL1_04853 [Corchorus capsularis]